ncbi:DEAD/DEAH box helicase [Paenibacillus filicis]|uniref:DEAD/DEAH box helicase n=1 Tax=Paenibacillus gyeongsangnamensis TaxID=3388067 RepID=A0ABT4Q6N8_9BACL|nr:DEAD/DEAH box helicase [Paenibacillus filicis]MCZ8512537.1 DEAD/DEAH box helicase [Paenibacillus filicis]
MIGLDTLLADGEAVGGGRWTVSGRWQGGVPVTARELRLRLFAWHRPSLYGIWLEEETETGRLFLSPFTALHYFAEPVVSVHTRVEWSEKLQQAREAAVIFKEALEKGWYAPDPEAWQEGRRSWKLLLPDDRLQADGRLLSGNPAYAAWFSAAIEEQIDSHPAVREAWERLAAEKPYLLEVSPEVQEPQGFRLDEEEWLVAAGWKKDEVPFRTCFQLAEPDLDSDGEAAWELRLVLQDKQDANVLVMPSAEDRLPADWAAYTDRFLRDRDRCAELIPSLEELAWQGGAEAELTDAQAYEFLQEGSLRLLQAGYSVFLPSWWEELSRHRPKLRAKLKGGGSKASALFGADQLVQFDWKVAVGGVELSEDEFLRMAAERKRLMYIRGRWIQLDPAFVAQVQMALRQSGRKKGLSFREILEMHLLQQEEPGAGSVSEGDEAGAWKEQLRIEVELNTQMAELIGRLQHTERIPAVEPPQALKADLRRYQREGVSWLLFMRRFGLGCCLADDMGLGKTVQFIAYLLHAREEKSGGTKTVAPALLICPTSVLGNWQKELERFAPSLNIYLHYGPQRGKGDELEEAIKEADLVLTSYNLAQIDEEELAAIHWDTIALDEAQNIKNAYTKQSVAVRRLEADHRIALTGTPIENRLTELWSIFDFINPGYLGTLSAFSHKYVNPIEKGGEDELVMQVQQLIRPFLLRRVKKDPAIQQDLPEKYETKAYVSLTVEQATLYENVVQELMASVDHLTGIEKKGQILAALTKLKQICDHPALFLKETGAATWEDRSSKVSRLMAMVQELRDEGDSCLIFTQFVEMGHLLRRMLEQELGERVQFLHGGVPKKQRDEMVATFQDQGLKERERCGIFILSLKAGGTGLNLTAANHVFHFDRWWNPAVENQATDRAFRIGQTRNVQVHKFVALGTLEERIDEMIERKQGLSQQIVGTGENWVTEMSTNELKELFALRREWMGK